MPKCYNHLRISVNDGRLWDMSSEPNTRIDPFVGDKENLFTETILGSEAGQRRLVESSVGVDK